MTAVEWLMDKYRTQNGVIASADYHTSKEMERKGKAKIELFIGKVSEVIGAEKTIELLKEVNNGIK